ncbi:hypothetical protein HUN41_00139 [Streptomyces phage Coruscant]|uniref:Uncharacterized protein n=1 Tax=Streptomyces phage Coruscant TaxID=2739834 RepID=A0A7G4AW66_9CAUD|nr:hypothetical protein PP454_gp161 [Streptomyces phage Coruscant]QMP84256.1 hypothetical protein HUN41_00139 [Streptomyces phage Coruscant]
MATTVTVHIQHMNPVSIFVPMSADRCHQMYVQARQSGCATISFEGYRNDILTVQLSEIKAIQFTEQ